MKKILFLMLLMGAFSPLINAYEYEFYNNPYSTQPTGISSAFFVDHDGNFVMRINNSGVVMYQRDINYIWLSCIKFNWSDSGGIYIKDSEFKQFYINDLNFLNDLYTSNDINRNVFFNYLYNETRFNNGNYIDYIDYQILYNDEGLAVESIVNGVWAGLYSDSQKSKSGAMYNKNGSLVYYNGKEVTPAISFFVWLQKFTNKVVIETFEEMQRSLISGIIVAVVLVLAIVRLVLELLPSSITPRRRRYYGGGRGSLPDYGDGSQVAASVRARLAAKNRALKARAYDRSGVEESTVNGILFDLENDR